jgi:hypothetical protein
MDSTGSTSATITVPAQEDKAAAVLCPTCGADVRYNGFTVETIERTVYMHFANAVARLRSSQSDGRVFCAECAAPIVGKTPRDLMRRSV